MSMKNRSFKNMLVQPKFQLKLSFFYVGIGGVKISIVGYLVLQKLNEVRQLMNNGTELTFKVQSLVNDLMLECIEMAFLGFLAFIIFSFSFALWIGHRIAGPQVAIKAVLDELKAGNFGYQRNLRPNDELTEIMDSVQALAAVLKQKEQANEST